MNDLIIPAGDAQLLLSSANADAALLYLFLRSGRPAEDACGALSMSESRRELALAELERLGLCSRAPQMRAPEEPPRAWTATR